MADDREAKKAAEVSVPVDVSNEQVVLAAMALLASVGETVGECDSLLSRVPDDSFLVEENRAACAALRELRRARLLYEASTFRRFAVGKVREDYLTQLAELQRRPSPNLAQHVEWILWDAQKAGMAGGSLADLLAALQNPREQPERVRSLARMIGESVSGEVGRARFLRDPNDLVRTSLAELRSTDPAYPYGIPALDFYEPGHRNARGEDIGGTPRLATGSAPGKITCLTGRSGSGKSTLAFRMALGLARSQKRKGVYLAWEPGGNMTLRMLACMSLEWKRLNCIQARSQDDVREPMRPEEWVALEDKMHRISKVIRIVENPFERVVDDRKQTNVRNLDLVHEHLAAAGGDWCVWDLFDRCLAETKPDEVSRAHFRVQSMMISLGMHGVLLGQQRIDGDDEGGNKRPTFGGVKGSKSFVEIADTLISPWRVAQGKQVEDTTAELIILKQRYGPAPLAIECDWDEQRGSFENGRTVAYEHASERGGLLGEFVSPETPTGRRGRRR